MNLKPSTIAKIEQLKPMYATPQGCIMPAITIVGESEGKVDAPRIEAIAKTLNVAAYEVAETLTFYTMFNRRGRGKNHLQICRNISCYLRGSDPVIKAIQDRLNVLPGEVTADGQFELEIAECLGDCDHAPCGILGEKPIRDLTVAKINGLLDELGAK